MRSFNPGSPFATDRAEGMRVDELTSFGEDACGRLYAASSAGPVYRIAGAAPPSCGNSATTPLRPSFVGIKALRRKVLRKKRAIITAWVSPCEGRRGQAVTLHRGRARVGVRHLNRGCSVSFRPRIRRPGVYRARVGADDAFVSAESRKLRIKIGKAQRTRSRAQRR